MVLPQEQVEPDHLDDVAQIAPTGDEIAPLAREVHEAHVDDAGDHEHPHHGEVPVARSTQPAAEREPDGNRLAFKWVATERRSGSAERRMGVEDPETGADHDADRNNAPQMGD